MSPFLSADCDVLEADPRQRTYQGAVIACRECQKKARGSVQKASLLRGRSANKKRTRHFRNLRQENRDMQAVKSQTPLPPLRAQKNTSSAPDLFNRTAC